MKKNRTMFIAQAAFIAALYVVFTYVANAFGLASGVIQVRLSEALCIMPFFTPAAVPGLFIGCVIGNILGGGVVLDVIFGSIATLIGAVGSYLLRNNRWLVPLPPIISNTLIIPFVLKYAYGMDLPILLIMLYILIGELLSCYVLGELLISLIEKTGTSLFKEE